ncbi:MAG: aspartate aminotransferase family protein [Myxococcota bacterium]|nr:aspartate aminotransferase family protein [Myxococcota bacterium]
MNQHVSLMPNIMSLEDRHTSGFYSKRKVAIERGLGASLWDSNGNEYIDCATGHGVAVLGHSHPNITTALTKQARRLITCPEILYNDQRARLLDRLAIETPSGIDRFFLCNSGTEAVEAAFKIARLSTGRREIIATKRAFHGRTMGSLSATWNPNYRKPFEPLVPGVEHVPYNDFSRVAEVISENTAAVIVELIQGEGGVRPADYQYLRGLRELCNRWGVLLIFDEVQTGFGRTGKMFACEHYDLAPDLLCLGKGMAGGLPMGAVGIGDRVIKLPRGMHGSTFGGNPLCCSTAIETMNILHSEQLIPRAERLGRLFKNELETLDSPHIKEVRGLGFMVGIELKMRVTPILSELMNRGVVALPAGNFVLRLLPPLVITRDQLSRVVNAIRDSLATVAPTYEVAHAV